MRPSSLLSFVGVSVAPALARPAETPTQSTKAAQFTVPSEADWGQPVIANVWDEQAVNAQDVCQGYKAENVQASEFGIIAELSLIGSACNVYGNDIEHLVLKVEYQSADRLNVKILPRDIGMDNWTWFVLPDDIVAPPVLDPDFKLNVEDGVPTNTDILFEWDNEQSFNFRVIRVSTGDVLFDTKGWALVFEDQFIEFGTHMPSEYNIYGLGEVIHTFKISNNHTRTLYAADTGDPIDRNAYGVHPFYLDTRYFIATENGKLEYVPVTKAIDKSVEYLSYSHGVYQRNAHGHELIMRPNDITWRSIGGSIDLYFFAGPTQSAVTQQYTTSAVGFPAMQQYWTFGFHQCRWGYTGWEEMRQLANDAAKFSIPVETFWADIDYMERYKNFANDPVNWSYDKGAEYLDWLHKNNMHFVPIVDSAIYIPNPDNPEDAYETFDRGMTANAFLKNPDGTLYIGAVWPGYTVFPDWVGASLNGTGTNVWWADELKRWHEKVQFDGIWIDMNEVASFCVGSCGTGNITLNPVHVPFKLPGEPGAEITDYPEDYASANATEASLSPTVTSSSSAKRMRARAGETTSSTTATKVAEITGNTSASVNTTATTTKDSGETKETGSLEKAEGTFIGSDGKLRTRPTPGGRNVNWPPYQIDHIHGDLGVHAVSPNATSHGGYQQYDFHSLFGHQILNATYHGLLAIQPDKRPFIIGRSTFPGSGKWAGHWGGDNYSKWRYMALSIPQMLTFQLSGIPLFGADACGFSGNSDMTLCTRWMELAAFTPFYRNHNVLSANSQEPWVWATTAEATRIAIGIRYQLLPYWYTLFYKAHTQGDTVMRALAWEFPSEPWLADAERQFLIGPAILVTPVLTPGADTVNGVFPGVSPNDDEKGEVWYDWYNQTAISSNIQRGENVTIDAPLTHIPIHLRGGYIIPIQEAKMTTAEGRNSSWSLLVPLNKMGAASGEVYVDDGISLEPKEATVVQFTADRGTLTVRADGNYGIGQPLANVTVMGVQEKLITTVNFHGTVLKEDQWVFNADDALLKIFGLGQLTADGAFTMDWEITWN